MAIALRDSYAIDAIDHVAARAREYLHLAIRRVTADRPLAHAAAYAERRLTVGECEPLFPLERNAAGEPFPSVLCISVNDQIANTPPGNRAARAGDLVTVDLGMRWRGWCADLARSIVVSPAPDDVTHLCRASEQLVKAGARAVAPGVLWSDVCNDVAHAAGSLGVHLVPGLPGHGIGRHLHEPPALDLTRPTDQPLVPGMVFTLEPVVTHQPTTSVLDSDGFGLRTASGCHAASWEIMVAVTEDGVRILGT